MQHIINFMTDHDGYCILLFSRLMCTYSQVKILLLWYSNWMFYYGVLDEALCFQFVSLRCADERRFRSSAYGEWNTKPKVVAISCPWTEKIWWSTSSFSHNSSIKILLLKDCAAPSCLPSFSHSYFLFLSFSFISALPSFPPAFLVSCPPIFISSIIMFFFISLLTTDYRRK